MIKHTERTLLYLFSLTLMLAAFLSFWIQPLLAKMVLPFLGGSPAVWNTCMMFFQGMLLAGYFYAHLSSKYLPKQLQVILQLGLLIIGFWYLPFVVDSSWILKSDSPITSLTNTLLLKVGLPFLALAASSPLLQRWFSHTEHPHAQDPYFLYVASNIGSLLSLVLFPFLLEPWISTSSQNQYWKFGFAALLVATGLSSMGRMTQQSDNTARSVPLNHNVKLSDRIYWIALAFIPSSLLLGVTTYITTDIASVPLFWIIPIVLYLLAFIIVFAKKPLWSVQTSSLLQCVVLLPFLYVFLKPSNHDHYLIVLTLHLALFFFTSMVCTGELADQRPQHQYLTEYYLWIALGGFLGGVFNTLVAPIMFTQIFEYPIVYVLALLLCPPKVINRIHAGIFLSIVAAMYLYFNFELNKNNLLVARNFYGSVRVHDRNEWRLLSHGTTIHGIQDLQHPKAVIGYYFPLKDLINSLAKKDSPLNIAVAGLGAGVTACVARPADTMTFFEIDPNIVNIASDAKYFSYLSECPVRGGIVMGDARLQLRNAPDTSFDAIVLDTFSSDAIPVHMLTQQAFEIYLSKLKPNGILLVHISNRYLNLVPVVAAIANKLQVFPWSKLFSGDDKLGTYTANWIMISRVEPPIPMPWNADGWTKLPQSDEKYLWTDDYSNVLRVMRW